MKKTYIMYAFREGKRFGADEDGVVLAKHKINIDTAMKVVKVKVTVEEVKEKSRK